jgi:cellulose synthase/poly-beta-1,6-N-acetylglucosamine synthase-like glycosyltransferase
LVNKTSKKNEEIFLKKFTSKLNIKYINQESNGKGNALREAANQTSGDILIFFDGD